MMQSVNRNDSKSDVLALCGAVPMHRKSTGNGVPLLKKGAINLYMNMPCPLKVVTKMVITEFAEIYNASHAVPIYSPMLHDGYVKDGKNNIPAYELQNISRAMTRGIELTASIKLPYGLTVSDELTFLDSEDKSKGQDLLYVPDVTNTLKLAYGAERSGFNGNIRVVSVGTQWVENNVRADGYTLVNAYLAKKVSSDTSLFFGVDNIFNEDPAAYGNIGGAGSTGTCFYGGLTFTL
ncbi:TonB-dependent receptor domain-containing protein [Chlorobium phaeobacteroides]|nr:TonB-dependent receptor [Chlorobium phaeobacteroides]